MYNIIFTLGGHNDLYSFSNKKDADAQFNAFKQKVDNEKHTFASVTMCQTSVHGRDTKRYDNWGIWDRI